MFPKTEAFSIYTTDWNEAVQFALSKRKFGGCYEKTEDGYTVYWLAKGDSRIQQFAW